MGCQVDSNATGLRLFVHVVCASRVHLLAPKIMVESVILPETGGWGLQMGNKQKYHEFLN
jgi:hypothetical protein